MSTLREFEDSRRSIMRVNPQRASSQRKSRKLLSCDPCRQRKVKCDRSSPCGQCVRHKTTELCHYSTPVRNRTTLETSGPVFHQTDQKSSPRNTENDTTPRHTGASESCCASDPASARAKNIPRGPETRESMIQRLGQSSFSGNNGQTRFFGRSHWALIVDMFPDLRDHLRNYHEAKKGNTQTEFSEYLSMRQSKHLMRQDARYCTQIKPRLLQPPRMKDLVPDRQTANILVDLYFSSFENTFRILHHTQFLSEYEQFWDNHEGTYLNDWSTEIFCAKLLALMACSSCFLTTNEDDNGNPSTDFHLSNRTAKNWIQAVVSWVKGLTNSSRLSLDVIQIKCLLFLARQAVGHDGDYSWLAGGSLLRDAIMIGLHRDPFNFNHMSPYWTEIRRRLWATIVELDLQAGLALGSSVSISEDEYDCQPPSNLDDEDLQFDSQIFPTSRPRNVLTRTSFLAILAETFNTRARIAQLINRIRLSDDYEEVLRLSGILIDHVFSLPQALLQETSEGEVPDSSIFRKSLLLFLIYRCLLALHRPYFLSLTESGSKIYSYSQKICTQASLAMLSPLAVFLESLHQNKSPVDGLYYLHLKGGMFRDELFHAAATLCFEIRLQTNENVHLPPLLHSDPELSKLHGQDSPESLFETVEKCMSYFEYKVRSEKQASKSYMLLHMFYASAKNAFSHRQNHKWSNSEFDEGYYTLEKACPRAAKRCRELLLHGVMNPPSKDTDTSDSTHSNLDTNTHQVVENRGTLQEIPDGMPFNMDLLPLQTDDLGPDFYNLAIDWESIPDPYNMFVGLDF